MCKKEIGENYGDLLCRFTQMSKAILGENLAGIYLHGSAAMGCFQPRKSDLDLLVIVKEQIPDTAKAAFMENVIKLNEDAPDKGLELSLVKREFCNPFVYPTPFELHFSRAHLEWYKTDPGDYIEKMQGTDKDLAAHFTITRRYGIVLWGEAIEDVFGEVPPEAYRDSILEDVRDAREDISGNPLYVTLNLCRVSGYLREGLILSKKAGGEWGLKKLPDDFHELIRDALYCYETGDEMRAGREVLLQFAEYILSEIELMSYVWRG